MYDQKDDLILLPLSEYVGVDRDDPIRFYNSPIFGHYYRKRVSLCLGQCKGGERILEVGFGTGATFFNLAKKYHQIHGVDLKADVSEIARMFSMKGLHVELKQGNVLELPYPEETFDTVLLISILEHILPQDLPRAFREIRRVLIPDGQLVYGTPVDNRITQAGFLLLGYNIRKHHFSSNPEILNIASEILHRNSVQYLKLPVIGTKIYEVGTFSK